MAASPSKIHLEIVTPDGVQLRAEVDELVAPSVQGEFGILPGHRPLLAGLRTGIVRYRSGQESHTCAIGPGFAKVDEQGVNLLTDRFIQKADVDPVVARKDLKEAEERLAELSPASPATELADAIKAARWAAICLELYGDPPPATIVVAHEIRLLAHEDYASLDTGEESDSAAAPAH